MEKLFFRVVLAIVLLVYGVAIHAANIFVDSNIDGAISIDGNCTLREALTAANFNVAYDGCNAGNSSGNDVIWVLPSTLGDAIVIETQLPVIDGVEIIGPGMDRLVLLPEDGYDGHLFQINMLENFSLKNLRIGGARSTPVDIINVDLLNVDGVRFISNTAAANKDGGALQLRKNTQLNGSTVSVSEVRIRNSEFIDNTAKFGGAVFIGFDIPVLIENSLFQGNHAASATGGAIMLTDDIAGFSFPAEITGSTFLNNNASLGGGAVWASQVHVKINQSLFDSNITNGSSPGTTLKLSSSLAAIENSTFTRTTHSNAPVIDISTGGGVSASETTFRFNTFNGTSGSQGNLSTQIKQSNDDATVFFEGNIVIEGKCQQVFDQLWYSNGYNIESEGATCTGHATDLPNTMPHLLPLGDYGGTMQSMPPSPLSVAVDAVVANCPDDDQLSQSRPLDGDGDGVARCDIGAVERPAAHQVNVSFAGTGMGQVHNTDFGLDCVEASGCIWPMPKNQVIELQASAQKGSTFTKWGGACAAELGHVCKVNVVGAITVTAEFDASVFVEKIFNDGFEQ